jgi:hypothetical protein
LTLILDGGEGASLGPVDGGVKRDELFEDSNIVGGDGLVVGHQVSGFEFVLGKVSKLGDTMDSLATSSDVFSVALINNLEVLLEDLEADLELLNQIRV